jgi:hypothetical protein
MRWRLLFIFIAITTGLGAVQWYVPPTTISRSRIVTTAASIICPNSASGANVAIGGQGTRLSPLGKLPKGLKDAPFTTSHPVTSRQVSLLSHVVENSSEGITQLDTTSGLAGLACPTADTSYWFVGGSASLSSQDQLILANAGHGDATATVLAWSDKGTVPSYPVVVPARSTIRVGLDSIAPGVNAVAFHILVRSGRVAVSLYDQRSQGLTKLGADFVPPGLDPAKNFVILGVPGTKRVTSTTSPRSSNKKSKTTTTKSTPETRVLRLLAPLVDTSVRVDVIGAGDSFTPLGLDSIQLKAGMVREIPVTAALPSTAYAFRVVADSPIVAGVFSTVNVGSGSDIAWSASTPSLSEDAVSADFDGTSYIFYSHDGASVDITTTGSSSALSSVTFPVPADNVVSWSPTKADGKVIAIRLHANGAAVYAARSLRTSDGLTTSPIRPISVTGRSTVPLADVGVGMPR